MDAEQLAFEHHVLTTSCGLIDRSARGKMALTGAQAKEFLTGQVTNDVLALAVGQGCYAAFLTPKGKMRGDLRVLNLGDELFLDTERSTLQELFTMIHRHRIGYQIEVHKRTLEQGLISLIGPHAREVAGAGLLGAQEYASAPLEVDGLSTVAVATDLGVDLICAASETQSVTGALLGRGAIAIGDEADETLRVESGRPRYGIDLDDTVIPQEAELNARAVSFTKGCYVGQETVARLFYKGKPNRHLRGLALSAPAAAGDALSSAGNDRLLGTLTSAAISPTFGPIGLALVRREAQLGETVEVGSGDITAEIVKLPFATSPSN